MNENIYETTRLVEEYLLFHYGTASDILSWEHGPADATGFPQRVARYAADVPVSRALDLGCAVGRSSYVLSETADEVIGIDYSQAFINAANSLRAEGAQVISKHIEAHVREDLTIHKPTTGNSDRITFQQGDAMNLPAEIGTFDRVLAANLICRLPAPEKLLDRLPSLVNPCGRVTLATPCTWLEEFTPPDHFPSGSTLDWLKHKMAAGFTLISQSDEPFLIRETARKFQWTVSQVTVWERK